MIKWVFIGCIIGAIIGELEDRYYIEKYGSPSLSVFLAKLSRNKMFSWLTYSVFGDDEKWYYDIVIKRMGKRGYYYS